VDLSDEQLSIIPGPADGGRRLRYYGGDSVPIDQGEYTISGLEKPWFTPKALLSQWNRRSVPNSWLESRDCLIFYKFSISMS
jgi:hypothetical protein